MAKIYFRRYKEHIELAQTEVPVKWRAAVIEMLEALEVIPDA